MEEKKTVQRIKRISLQAGILLCLCFFTGCRSGSDTANTIQNGSQRCAAFCRIQENSYFSHQEADGMQYLYYYDEKTNTASPLCGRAECTHNTTACSACIGNALGMQTDGKSIYWISPGYTAEERVNGYSYMLYRVSADGTKRKCLRKLSEVSENLLPTANLMALYDSEHAFICGNKSIITDGEPVITTALYVFWQNNDEMKTLYEETYPAAPVIQIYRNQLYLSLTRQIIAEEGDEVKLSSECELRRYNMETNWILFRIAFMCLRTGSCYRRFPQETISFMHTFLKSKPSSRCCVLTKTTNMIQYFWTITSSSGIHIRIFRIFR